MAEMDYQVELRKIESEIQARNDKKQKLQGLLEAKQAELKVVEEEILSKFGCAPEELASKGAELKESLEKNILDMKHKLGLT